MPRKPKPKPDAADIESLASGAAHKHAPPLIPGDKYQWFRRGYIAGYKAAIRRAVAAKRRKS